MLKGSCIQKVYSMKTNIAFLCGYSLLLGMLCLNKHRGRSIRLRILPQPIAPIGVRVKEVGEQADTPRKAVTKKG